MRAGLLRHPFGLEGKGRRGIGALVVVGALLWAPQALSATFTVTVAGDAGDGSCDASCTLRDAIVAANAAADADTIEFSVVPGGTVLITPGSALPGLVQPATIDGLTQPGAGGNPVVDINGAGLNARGLQLFAASTIRGLTVRGFLQDGIVVQPPGAGSVIERNHVGVDVAGATDFGNGGDGILVQAANVSVGGDSPSARNVVSGNTLTGIHFAGAVTAGGIVRGNYIGTNAAGTAAIPNSANGIVLDGADDVTVGGSAPGTGNLVSGNGIVGVYFLGATNSRAWGNRIGTNAAGTGAIANQLGVQILGGAGAATGNAVGGGLAGEGNVVSGNTSFGILVNHLAPDVVSGNTIAGNLIGLTADGGSPLGNGGDGIAVAADADAPVSIGSTDPVDANSIAANLGAGISVADVSRRVEIGINSIRDNDGLGIDLFPSGGVTPNDPAGDADVGGNDLQNFPVLTKAESGGGATDIEGTLTSAASTAYRVDHYLSNACDASGNGEGSLLLGSQTVNTDPDGIGGFDFVYGAALTPGEVITSVATDPSGNTSEFSACFTITSTGGAFVVNSAADPGSGTCDGAECTLREAIAASNASAGADAISFAIGSGVQTIALASALPALTDTVTIDGTTQPGFAGAPLIELDGAAVTASAGLQIAAPDVEVKGLAVMSFGAEGVHVQPGATSARVSYVNVGTNSAGTLDRGNGGDGIQVEAPGAEIGFDGQPNRIVGNGGAGVRVLGAGTSGTAVITSVIGVGAGQTAIPNADGIVLQPLTSGTLVRGSQVSGNTGSGIHVFGASDTTIIGSFVGTNAAGTVAIPNGIGIRVEGGDVGGAFGTTIGGTGPADPNTISGNGGDGILLVASEPNAVGNTQILGNRIGADVSGTAPVPNGGHGVHVAPDGGITNTTIGGTTASRANTIRFNAGDGVFVENGSGRVQIAGNQIDGNGGLGIDLAPDGATPNDPGDGDTGGNALVNFPGIATVVAGGSVRVTGSLDASPPGLYELDFYANATCDPSGNGEGDRYLGRFTLLAGPGTFDTGSGLGPAAVGEFITATATDPLGNTSELSTCAAAQGVATFVVTTGADSSVTPGCDAAECTLREAIDGVNAFPGPGTPRIHFAIGSGPATISPVSPLPPLTGPSLIDGFTQPGASGVPIVFLDGAGVGSGGDGLVLAAGAGGTEIRGLAVGNFPDAGILLDADGNLVEDVFSGIAPGGTVAGNGTGILVTGDGNTIGGVNFGARNLLSGNSGAGLHILDGDGTTVRANLVGTDFAGTAARPNATGIVVAQAANTTIGLPGPVAGTSISAGVSGNSGDGIRVQDSSTNTIVQGNVIGFDATGAILANGGHGIVVADTNGPTTIGGAAPELDNIIGGADNGIYLVRAQGTTVLGNKIGVDEAVTTAVGGSTIGIAIEDGGSNIVGGLAAGAGNVVGGAADAGISIAASPNNTVVGNAVGTDPAGTLDFGNGTDGIRLATATTLTTIDRNTIAFNGEAGVAVAGSASNRNRITRNAIDDNSALGIDLGANAVTPNDPNDEDDGPNELQNFPVLASAPNIATETTVTGTLASAPSTAYTIELFSSPTCSIYGNGEGRTFQDDVVVTTNAAGDATVFAILGDLPIGHVVTATATDPAGNTSEFGPCVAVTTGAAPPNATASIAATAGSTLAGAARVELGNVPPSALLAAGGPGQTASAPLADIPLADIPLADIPLADIPLADIGFAGVAGLLDRVPLASAPLLRPGGWQQLVGTLPALASQPIQTLTFGDVFGLLPLPPAVASITVDELDLSNSELGRLSELVLPLGGALLTDLPLDWCAELSAPPISCSGGNPLPAGSSVLSIALRGAPLADIPLADIPLADIPLADIPLADIPLADIPLADIPLADIPLADIPLADIPLADIPLADIPLADIPLADIQALFGCTTACPASGTLGSNIALLDPAATLGDLLEAIDGLAPAALRGTTIGQLLGDLPPSSNETLGGLLLLVLGRGAEASWERLDLVASQVQRYATTGGTTVYQASFELSPGSGPFGVDVTVTVPPGFLYVPGSAVLKQIAPAGPDTPLPNPSIAGRELTWTVVAQIGTQYRIDFTTLAGLGLGAQDATVEATPAGGTTAAGTAPIAVDVGDTFEPNGLGSPQQVAEDSFYLSYITSDDDVDVWRFPVPATPDTRVTIRLSHLPADYDLVVYGPPGAPLRPSIATTPRLDTPPVVDEGVAPTHVTDALPPETLGDLRVSSTLPLAGVSANRGTEQDDVVVFSPGGSGFFTIQVAGFNGASGPQPYMLRVETTPPPAQPPVPARAVTGVQGTLPGALPAGLNTLFVLNRQQLEGLYGAAPASGLVAALNANLAPLAALGFPSAVLQVDGDAGVRSAYAAWNASPGNPVLANAVVAQVNRVVDGIRALRPTLRNLVLLGGDPAIPLARLDDYTTLSNEAGYADAFGNATDLFSALRTGKILSDDAYGDVNPVPYLQRQLHVPELAVGRLVESPADMIGAIGRFVSFGGTLDPATALTTGYDFLTDGAQGVKSSLDARVGAGSSTGLISPGWTKANLQAAFLPAAGAPSLSSLNAHADHFRLQPANASAGLFTTADLPPAAATALQNRIVFSMGCHAGLSVADVTVGAQLDWPQAYAERGATYLGNTTYGYGDTVTVAYSEELNGLFAQAVTAGSTVGNALVTAKQRYFGTRGVFGVYDEKAMAGLTLYGLPMWSVTGPAAAASAGGGAQVPATGEPGPAGRAVAAAPIELLAVGTDPATGLETETFAVDPAFETVPTDRGTFLKDAASTPGIQVTHLRPIQPKVVVPLTGATAHGALITELASSDAAGVDPVFAFPSFGPSANEPERPFTDVAFPAKLQWLRTLDLPGGRSQQLVLVTGQFFGDGVADAAGVGIQRRFTHIAGSVLRSPSTDYVAPAILRTEAVVVGPSAGFTVDVTDPVGGTAQVKRVLVGARSGSASVWAFADLAQSPSDPTRWSGGMPVSGTQLEYFVQAVDTAGNVAVSTNKGLYYAGAVAPPPPSGGISVAPSAPPPPSGWYPGPVGLVFGAPDGVEIEASIDGGQYGAPPASITGDGVHRVVVRGSNGGTATLFVAIDGTPPEIVIGSPAAGAQYALGQSVAADYACRDHGSGVATPCTGTVPSGDLLDTSTLGAKTFTVGAVTDAAGRTAPARTVSYSVVYRKILFASRRTGFGDVYAMNANGTGVSRLTTTAAAEEQPAWSPDGSRIAFASRRDGNWEIYVMNADGSAQTRLTTASGDDTAPAWSPDGARIAFSSTRHGANNAELYVMNADGSGQTRLTNSARDDLTPAWSPDGQKIAFASYRIGPPDIYVMNANGSGVTRLTSDPQFDLEPTWKPDGTRIAFSSSRFGQSNYEILLMNPNGSGQTRLTGSLRRDSEPAWSRDGLKIVFTSDRIGPRRSDVFVMNANGSAQVRLTSSAFTDHTPDW